MRMRFLDEVMERWGAAGMPGAIMRSPDTKRSERCAGFGVNPGGDSHDNARTFAERSRGARDSPISSSADSGPAPPLGIRTKASKFVQRKGWRRFSRNHPARLMGKAALKKPPL